MPYHHWEDSTFDWNGLYAAERKIASVMRLFRIGCHHKEKWGRIRATPYFWDGGLHHLIWPGYVYVQSGFIAYKLDRYLIKPITRFSGIHYLGGKLQILGYCLAYYLAMRAHPHLKDEIAADADYPQYIIGGKAIHDKHWTLL